MMVLAARAYTGITLRMKISSCCTKVRDYWAWSTRDVPTQTAHNSSLPACRAPTWTIQTWCLAKSSRGWALSWSWIASKLTVINRERYRHNLKFKDLVNFGFNLFFILQETQNCRLRWIERRRGLWYRWNWRISRHISALSRRLGQWNRLGETFGNCKKNIEIVMLLQA